MQVRVDVVVDPGSPRPEPGTPVVVEIRDVSLADAPSTTMATTKAHVSGADGPLASVTVELDDHAVGGGRRLDVWAKVSPGQGPGIAAGDWITMQSVPLRSTDAGTAPITAPVRRVGGVPPTTPPPHR